MDGTQHILASADPVQSTPGEPEQVDGRFLLAVVLLVVLPIFIVLPAAALARGTLLGTLLIDAEVATLSSEEESDVEDDNLDELDAAAPSKSYEQVKQETENDKTGEHLAWPDSFYECVICLDVMNDEDIVRRLCCGHIFHSDCIGQWYLRRHHTCPLCMLHFIPDDNHSTHSRRQSRSMDDYEWRRALFLL